MTDIKNKIKKIEEKLNKKEKTKDDFKRFAKIERLIYSNLNEPEKIEDRDKITWEDWEREKKRRLELNKERNEDIEKVKQEIIKDEAYIKSINGFKN